MPVMLFCIESMLPMARQIYPQSRYSKIAWLAAMLVIYKLLIL